MTEAGGAAGATTNRALVTISVMMATTVVLTDQTIAAIALPHMQGGLSSNQDQIAWVMTTYFMAQAVTTACTGWIAGRIGRKRTYLIALIGFTTCSILSGSATSLPEILVYRAMQGMFSAPVIPISQALMLDSYPRERHGFALAIWGVGVMFAPVISPVVGGWMTDSYGWSWIFYVAVPFAVVAVGLGWGFMPETQTDQARRFDWFGFTALAMALASLQLMLDRGEFKGWFGDGEIVIEATLVALGLYLFLAHSATTRNPFISPAIVRDRNVVVGCAFMFLLGVCVLSMNVILPMFLQGLRGFPVLTAGLIMAPRGAGTLFSLIVSGWLVKWIDGRWVIATGFGCVAYSAYLFSTFTMDVGIGAFIFATVFNGMGIGFIFVPLTTITFETLPIQYRTEASTLTSLFRNYGSGVGISVVISVLSRTSTVSHSVMTEHITPYRDAMRTPFLPEHWSLTSPEGRAALEVEIARQSEAIGFLNDFNALMIVTALSIPLVLLLKTAGPMRRAGRRAG
jgi:DHA2 family multidrug resistance protein